MRIDLNLKTPEAADPAQTSKSGAQVNSGAGNAGAISDTAVLSPDQSRVQALAAQVSQLPEIRQEKVAALAHAIETGVYQVQPQETAEALLSQIQVRSAA
ncbi:MAG: flagellar biosynthesis anti-sigma factor FlgM [Terriglobales bacterium]|jgi:flagellar biosynthesis anti-sigma factor FlgM